jgi:hypothetical protein
VCRGLGGFLGCRTLGVKARTILGNLGWSVTLTVEHSKKCLVCLKHWYVCFTHLGLGFFNCKTRLNQRTLSLLNFLLFEPCLLEPFLNRPPITILLSYESYESHSPKVGNLVSGIWLLFGSWMSPKGPGVEGLVAILGEVVDPLGEGPSGRKSGHWGNVLGRQIWTPGPSSLVCFPSTRRWSLVPFSANSALEGSFSFKMVA